MQVELTSLEKQLLADLATSEHNALNGGAFTVDQPTSDLLAYTFLDTRTVFGTSGNKLNIRQLKGVLAHLCRKGLIFVDPQSGGEPDLLTFAPEGVAVAHAIIEDMEAAKLNEQRAAAAAAAQQATAPSEPDTKAVSKPRTPKPPVEPGAPRRTKKIMAFECLLEGKTLEEMAECVGVSYPAARSLIGDLRRGGTTVNFNKATKIYTSVK